MGKIRTRLLAPVMAVALVVFILVTNGGCGVHHYLMGQTIRPGMTFDKVYGRMGKPDLGFGLPQKGSTEKTWLYYRIPFGKYLIVNFIGYVVDDPPISIEDRRWAVIE